MHHLKKPHKDFTEGSIPRNLWHLAWPQITESFLSVVDQLADLIWAGRLGFQAMAGLGVAQTFLMMTMTVRMGIDAGMRAMISRAVGAGEIAYANHVMLQSLTLTTAYSVLIVTAGVLITDPFLRLLGLGDDLVSEVAPYMQIQFFAMAIMGYQRLTAGALQASGDSITPLRAAALTRVVHLAFTPMFIFGIWWFPSSGLAGAALANLIAQILGVGWNVIALRSDNSRLHLTLNGYHLDRVLLWKLVKVGIPASVTNAQRAVSQLLVVIIVSQFGNIPLAAFALYRRIENTVNHASRGLGRAAGVLAGQNLGAGKPVRAKQSISWALAYAGVASLSIAIIFLIFPNEIARLFNDQPDFVSQTANWLQILAIGYFSMNTVQVFTQAFNTTGATMVPMVVTVSTMWVVELPLAFVLSQYTFMVEYAVPWAIVIGMTLRLSIFSVYYLQGKWLRTGVI